MDKELLDIVDLNNIVIGQATREEIYAQKHVHRIVHVIVRDKNGNFLLQKRAENVKYLPLYWSTAVGGHVQAGETYEQAALREMAEEIGVQDVNLKNIGTFFYEGGGMQKFLGVFDATIDDGFVPGVEEVVEVQFFSPEEAYEIIMNEEKIHPELKFLWKKLYT